MNRSVETHTQTMGKMISYIANFKSQYVVDKELTVEEKTDLLGRLSFIKKEIEDFLDVEKKTVIIPTGQKEIFGLEYKAKIQKARQYEIPVDILRKELSDDNFLLCVKTVSKHVETFLPKSRIEAIKVFTGEKISVSFEKI